MQSFEKTYSGVGTIKASDRDIPVARRRAKERQGMWQLWKD
jgi:hypothetical protein